ncbi:hypothetical protein CVD25_12875 [Bacillus canaveralius]|uniref:Uncharacterized protein n=1 Tax=Bacillus canaveralius TaxID=1403243 RepID=A0A2N5GNM4_9BACI|nr:MULTISPECIES: hypothetical protein [Bacillus]PLR84070.1 hypothetical protein CU635_07130 [Bacillus canaveralius]PLR87303.1 hypothetical protein CVD23_03605 [Bacillus sp. V33-4]PLR96284.1 hypothetical protein CVD25_12875 [Bacillus canaveralius]RSK53530.1 peptidyl-prolyl cis-trans isomerase [Bacillus canaveralius]
MDNIIFIKGKVKYPITLDPGVWIFDDRRLDLKTYFNQVNQAVDELENYTKSISKHWDREIMEGAVYPPTLKSEKKFEKEKVLTGTFGMPLLPFIHNAEPETTVKTLIVESTDGEVALPIEQGKELILCFSKNGKPLRQDGPVYAFFGDGSNRDKPLKNIKGFRLN